MSHVDGLKRSLVFQCLQVLYLLNANLGAVNDNISALIQLMNSSLIELNIAKSRRFKLHTMGTYHDCYACITIVACVLMCNVSLGATYRCFS